MQRSRRCRIVLALGCLVALAGRGSAQKPSATAASPGPRPGTVQTVRGVVSPAELGMVLTHEHLFIDQTVPADTPEGWRSAGRSRPVAATDVAVYDAPLRMGLLGAVVMGAPNRDNWLLTDERLAASEVSRFRQHGGGALVDLTNVGVKRDPAALRRVSEATGLHVVMGSGWYRRGWYPADLGRRPVESLADEIAADITIGVSGTGIRAGIIGEIGLDGLPMTDAEIAVVRASARASRVTGAAISLSAQPRLDLNLQALDLIQAEGGDLSRVVVGSAHTLASDAGALRRLLDRGVYLQFDALGRQPTVRTAVSDTDVAATIVELIKAGHLDRILLSQDVCSKVQLRSFGGTGYAFVPEFYTAYLTGLGVTEAQLHRILVENPARVLPLAAPVAGAPLKVK